MMGIAAIGAAAGLAGCGESRNSGGAAEPEPSPAPEPSPSPEPSPAPEPEPEPELEPESAHATSLVLIFSRAGENYSVGTVEVGNTMVLAKMIAEKTGADLFELERVTAYPTGYDACCDEALAEQHANARPELKALPDLSGYDTIYFGFPCWWGDLPMPVYSAVEALDWNGKTISPFNTHEGSGESGMFSRLKKKCAGATVTAGLTISGSTAQRNRESAEKSVDSWLEKLS